MGTLDESQARIIIPISVSDSTLQSATGVPEDDHDEWDAVTTFSAGDFVISTDTHMIYESLLDSNIANDPTDDDNIGVYWNEYSATNRWKLFDGKLADQMQYSSGGFVRYDLTPQEIVTAIAFFNAETSQIRIRVFDATSGGTKIYDQTKTMTDDSEIYDFYTAFTTDLSDKFVNTAIFDDLTINPGYLVWVDLNDGASTASIGEMVLGRYNKLGQLTEDTELELEVFSERTQDVFGNFTIVPRGYSKPIRATIVADAGDSGRLMRIFEQVIDEPVVIYGQGDDVIAAGFVSYGYVVQPIMTPSMNHEWTYTLETEALS